LSLVGSADVLLDPIHFGGGNTSFEAFAQGTPIVTLPSPFLRGRITLALYRHMGILDCVADDEQDYIARAVRLGTDADYRQAMRRRIRDASAVLFENPNSVKDLENFFRHAVAQAAKS